MGRKTKILYKMRSGKLRWCDNCNLPILEKRTCGICRNVARPVKLVLPGDARPAFEKDHERIWKAIDEQFGDGLGPLIVPKDKLVIINKAGWIDRADEVIVDGWPLGLLIFEPRMRKWIFKPSLEGARRIWKYGGLKWIKVDRGAAKALSAGKNLLAPGVIDIEESIKEGDEAYAVSPEGFVVAVGKAKVNSDMIGNRGIVLRTRVGDVGREPSELPGGQSWEDAVKANIDVLKAYEKRAILFLKRIARNSRLGLSFSGGKDSMAHLILALKALGRSFNIIFIDTGIEYPETIEYTFKVMEKYGLKNNLYVISAEDAFWRGFKIFGPPAKNYRWCCKVCKLAPMKRALNEVFGGQAKIMVASRGVESIKRFERGSIWKSRWIIGETGVSAIYDWPTLLVWLYLFKEGAPINPLYMKGYSRIGCWPCPASDLADLHETSLTHPDLWNKFERELMRWCRSVSLDREVIKNGEWRILGDEDPRKRRSINVLKEFSYKKINILNSLGRVILINKNFIKILDKENREKVILKDGQICGSKEVLRVLSRYDNCVRCKLCELSCPQKAIKVRDKPTIDEDKCNHCGLCNVTCPIYVYYQIEL